MINLFEWTPSNKLNAGIKINLNFEMKDNEIELFTQNKEECRVYCEYLNYVVNTIKTKLYSNNGNKILISNY